VIGKTDMLYLFSLLLLSGACALLWSLWQGLHSPLKRSFESLHAWRRWHQDSLAWSRPKAVKHQAGQHAIAESSAADRAERTTIDKAGFGFLNLAQRWRLARDLRVVEKATPELLAFLARAIRAGHALPTAVIWAGERFPGPMGEAFSRIRAQLHGGIPLGDALDDFASRYPLAELRMLVIGLRIAQDLGGPLPDLLDQLAANSRTRLRLAARVKALSAEARWSGWFLGLLPILLASGLSIWRPEHMAVLWTDPRGQGLSLAALTLSLGGALWMRSLVQQVNRNKN
jgi:Type II secretion system (T2SS), protein F